MKGRDLIRELDRILAEAGVTVKFGLREQGHMTTVDRMLAEGKTWDEIAKAVRWSDGETVKRFYETEKESGRA
jgi:hypothetical protein